MKKLNTLRRNIDKYKAERLRAASQREFETCVLKVMKMTHTYPDVIMNPPQDLVDLYSMEVEVYASKNILGDSTYTREQMSEMLDTFLYSRYREHQALEALGICNRRSYWKPSAKLCPDRKTIEISLGHKKIGTIS